MFINFPRGSSDLRAHRSRAGSLSRCCRSVLAQNGSEGIRGSRRGGKATVTAAERSSSRLGATPSPAAPPARSALAFPPAGGAPPSPAQRWGAACWPGGARPAGGERESVCDCRFRCWLENVYVAGRQKQ